MSTRATYQFERTSFTPTVTIYCHYDGYREGAAQYFLAMLESNGKGGWADKFIKGNADQSELTMGHDAHGDTDYRYTVSKAGNDLILKVHKRIDYGNEWRVVYNGQLDEFLNKFAKDDHRVPVVGTITQTVALKNFKQCFFDAVDWAKRGAIGNGAGCISRAKDWGQICIPIRDNVEIQAMLDIIDQWYKDQFKQRTSPEVVEMFGEKMIHLLKGEPNETQETVDV